MLLLLRLAARSGLETQRSKRRDAARDNSIENTEAVAVNEQPRKLRGARRNAVLVEHGRVNGHAHQVWHNQVEAAADAALGRQADGVRPLSRVLEHA